MNNPLSNLIDEKQGKYTINDYYALPEERRVELIDGWFYDIAAPYPVHQLVGGQIYAKLLSYIMEKGGECIPMMAPTGVQLDRDDKTMVEPDVLVVCDRSKIHRRIVYGAPDLIIEVLSVSTRKKDMVIKLEKYLNAGVREYWLADPLTKKVLVYDFEHYEKDMVYMYTFSDSIPVRIFNGDLLIDFSAITDYISFLEHAKD